MTPIPLLAVICAAFLVHTSNALSSNHIDRRQALSQATAASCAATIGIVLATPPAFAEDTATPTSPPIFQEGPGGIKYSILKEGTGDKALRAQKVYTKYTLWTGGFGDDGGKQVDSNTGFMGRPLGVIVGVGQVIKGWDLTLLDMKEGETRRIIVPSDLGYGDQGAGGSIPPKATLYFEMEVTNMDPLPNSVLLCKPLLKKDKHRTSFYSSRLERQTSLCLQRLAQNSNRANSEAPWTKQT